MSRLVKSNRLILDNQAYQLAPQVIPPLPAAHPHSGHQEDAYGAAEGEEEPIDIEELVRQRMEEVEEEARLRLQEAEQDRDMMLREAFEKAEEIRESAREEGYEAGRQVGFEEGRTVAESLIQEALAVKAQILEQKQSTARQIENDTVQLIIDTVERILGKHIQEDYDLILGIVKMAMGKLTYTESLVLRVSPEDFDMALSVKDQILALAENVDDINIKPDKSLKQGSCILDAASGSIDSSIWTQFEQIKEGFEEMLASE